MAVLTYRDALNAALREEMHRDDNVFLMGEEVAEYNGAYKVTRGLLEEFGARRVVDTPIAELGFTGIGVGAAMVGLRPVIEMMTMNFALLAIDQIVNNAAKIRYMSGGQIGCPLVIRGPGGAALQLGAQHSQAFESWYAHIPGLKVVMPATPADAKGLLKAAIRDDNPVMFIEGEMLYNLKGEVPDGEHIVPLGKADIKREGKDVTIICHSKTVAPGAERGEDVVGRRDRRRGDRPAHDPAARPRDDPRLGRQDQSRRGRRRGLGLRRRRCAGGRRDPARGVRFARRAHHPRPPGRRADAVQQAPREGRQGGRDQDRRGRPPGLLPELTTWRPKL